MLRNLIFAVAIAAAAAATPRVAFVRTITPAHDLGGDDVIIIYALGDSQKLDGSAEREEAGRPHRPVIAASRWTNVYGH